MSITWVFLFVRSEWCAVAPRLLLGLTRTGMVRPALRKAADNAHNETNMTASNVYYVNLYLKERLATAACAHNDG